MAKVPEDESLSVNLILQNLSKRPNVRSTLILSRKNGSIIKASGVIADESQDETERRSQHNTIDSSKSDVEMLNESVNPGAGTSEPSVEEPQISRAQILAASIYAFVSAAVNLGNSWQSVGGKDSSLLKLQESARVGSEESSNAAQSNIEAYAEDDVQLLRLRLKKQEIIIFPDPHYLCCVVQDLEKNAR